MATISDVARDAGVSTSTVSYVLSGRRPISPATRARVEASIAALGYRPNAGARALASSRTSVLALVAPLRADVNVPVIMQFVTSVVTAARRYDHDVLLLTKDEGTAGLDRVAGSRMVDGLIVMDIESEDERLPVLRRLTRPAVLIGLPSRSGGIACVDLDFAGAAEACVQHLADHGHRSVALVGPAPVVYQRGTSYAARFLAGFEEATRRAGMRAVAYPCESHHEGVAACLKQIDRELPGNGALVVHNEAALPSVLGILRADGRPVPEEVSVVALCPPDVALAQATPLTSVDIPAEQVGSLAVEMVMGLLAGRTGTGGRRLAGPAQVPIRETRLLAPVLTERGSCAAPYAQ